MSRRTEQRRRERASFNRRMLGIRENVQPGEAFVLRWCCDCAECDCPPRGHHIGVPWLSIATGTSPEYGAYQRCLTCGIAWTARSHRWQQARVIRLSSSAEARP